MGCRGFFFVPPRMTTPSPLQIQLLHLRRVAEIYTNSATDPQGRIVGARLEDAHDFIKGYFERLYARADKTEFVDEGKNYMKEVFGFARNSMLTQMFKEGQSISRSGGSKTHLNALRTAMHVFSKTWPRNALDHATQVAQPV